MRAECYFLDFGRPGLRFVVFARFKLAFFFAFFGM